MGNLILTRNAGQVVVLTLPDGTRAYVTVLKAAGGVARLAIEAPSEIRVDREEVDAKRAAARERQGS